MGWNSRHKEIQDRDDQKPECDREHQVVTVCQIENQTRHGRSGQHGDDYHRVGQARDAAGLIKPEHIEYHKWGQCIHTAHPGFCQNSVSRQTSITKTNV